MANFKCLYYFTSPNISVIEIKRTDLAENAPLSETYKWLVIFNSSQTVVELKFKSMSKTDSDDFRSFSEGDLKFNLNEGDLNLRGERYGLERRNHEEVAPEILKTVEGYLEKSSI